MKFLGIGVIVAIISSIISYFVFGIDKAHLLPTILGFIFVGAAILMSGSLLSGPEMLANMATESNEDRKKRNRVVWNAVLLGVPCFVLAWIIFKYL